MAYKVSVDLEADARAHLRRWCHAHGARLVYASRTPGKQLACTVRFANGYFFKASAPSWPQLRWQLDSVRTSAKVKPGPAPYAAVRRAWGAIQSVEALANARGAG